MVFVHLRSTILYMESEAPFTWDSPGIPGLGEPSKVEERRIGTVQFLVRAQMDPKLWWRNHGEYRDEASP